MSDEARNRWEHRFVSFAECWRQIEWLTVLDGFRPCALVYASQEEFASLSMVLQDSGLRTCALQARLESVRGQEALVYRIGVGTSRNLRRMKKAWADGDHGAMGELLGYPQCCVLAFLSLNAVAGIHDGAREAALRACGKKEGISEPLEIDAIPDTNLFWSSVGVRLVPHYPCSFSCHESIRFAERFAESGTRAGYQKCIETAREILSWPIEWSSLHGIAEIKTPILKMSHNTEMLSSKRIVRWRGASYPKEGAQGLGFPYQVGRDRRSSERSASLQAQGI